MNLAIADVIWICRNAPTADPACVVDCQAFLGPAVVLGFGSIPYPAVSLRDESLSEMIAEAVKAHGLGTVDYFPGISDMSFVGETTGMLLPLPKHADLGDEFHAG